MVLAYSGHMASIDDIRTSLLFMPESDLLHAYLNVLTFKYEVDETINGFNQEGWPEDGHFTSEEDVHLYGKLEAYYFYSDDTFNSFNSSMGVIFDSDTGDFIPGPRVYISLVRNYLLEYATGELKEVNSEQSAIYLDPYHETEVAFHNPLTDVYIFVEEAVQDCIDGAESEGYDGELELEFVVNPIDGFHDRMEVNFDYQADFGKESFGYDNSGVDYGNLYRISFDIESDVDAIANHATQLVMQRYVHAMS